MDIAIITPTLYCLGAERQIEFLALGLHQKGYLVTVYCLFDDGPIADILQANGVRIVRLYSQLIKRLQLNESKNYSFDEKGTFIRRSGKIMYRAARFINELQAALKLLIIFLKHKPEVVHLYQIQTKMAILAGKLSGVRRIIYTETCFIGDWLTSFQLSLMKIFWKFCDVVIVLSASMKDHMLKLNLIDSSKVYLIPTMLPVPNNVIYAKKNNDSSEVNIGTVGKLSPEKGHVFFLKAASLIRQRFANVKFIIAGDGYLMGELKRISRELGIMENVKFLGAFKHIDDVMSQIDIFVLSSLTEGMPVVLLEAAAYGKPIVATDVGGNMEFIIDGETGFLVPPGNPEALAQGVNKLIDNPEIRIEFLNKMIKRFKEVYSTDKVIPQLERIYCT